MSTFKLTSRSRINISEVARQLNVSRQSAWGWLTGKKPTPYKRLIDMERITGIPREELRPELYQQSKPEEEK